MKDEAPRNPFRYGALALDEAFTDRERELRTLEADIRNGQDVVVFSARRLGKSSLVWRARRDLAAEGVLVAYVDLMRAPTKQKLAEKLAQAIHDDLASPLLRARERLRVFRGLRIAPAVSVDPEDGSVSFGFGTGYRAEDVDATLERLLELPGRLGAERGRRVALVLDEFQEVVEIDPRLPRLMRAVFQEQPEVAHVYLGSKRHTIARLFGDEQEPFWRSAKQMELGVIAPELFRGFVRERFRASGKEAGAEAVDAVLDVTKGHPYATQELCYFLWEETPAGEAATLERVERALADVLNAEHAHFSLVWEKAAPAQRLVLQALAREQPGRPLSADYRQRHRLPVAPTVQKALRALGRDGLVARGGRGEYAIVEPFLSEWLRRAEA